MSPGRIYILPTSSWAWILAVLLAMWYAAVSQTNSAAYLLMFFLGSLVMVTAVHAHYALAGVTLRVGRIEPVFAGELARVPVEVLNLTPREKVDLAVAPNGRVFKETSYSRVPNVAASGAEGVEILLPGEVRGRLVLRRLALTTDYPMGFFRSWKYEATDAAGLVYPKPQGTLPLPLGASVTADTVAGREVAEKISWGCAPTRRARASVTLTGVRWRAANRISSSNFPGRAPAASGWSGRTRPPCGTPKPAWRKISRWIVDAEPAGYAYGLRLPGFEAEPVPRHGSLSSLSDCARPVRPGRRPVTPGSSVRS